MCSQNFENLYQIVLELQELFSYDDCEEILTS